MTHFGKILFLWGLFWAGTGMAGPRLDVCEPLVAEVIGNPSAAYRKSFGFEVHPEVWKWALDNPFRMGQIWALYQFQPAYRVTQRDDGIHIVDPTGITGDLCRIEKFRLGRIFYGRAAFDHWAVPSFFTAEGVIALGWKETPGLISGEAKIYIRGNNLISRAVMKLFSRILIRRIDSRFTHHLECLRKILDDLERNPLKIREVLEQ